MQQEVEGVALADLVLVEALHDHGAVLASYARRLVCAVVGHDEGGHQLARIGLAVDTVDEVSNDHLLISCRNEHGEAVQLRFLVRLGLDDERYKHIKRLICIADEEHDRENVVDHAYRIHASSSCL